MAKGFFNAKIQTVTNGLIENGYIVWSNGKIIELGESQNRPESTIIDCQKVKIEYEDLNGMHLYPGFVDPHSHIGMWEDGVGFEGDDGNECVDPVTPHLRAIDAINPDENCFKEARERGFTTVVTGPGSANVFGGQFAAIKTYGRYVDEMIIKEPVALKAALGENPKTVYNDRKESPMTRMATAAIFRETMLEAKQYLEDLENYEKDPKEFDKPEFDLKKEILIQALKGELLVKFHAHRKDDIMTAIRLGKEFGLKYTIEHCTEGYMIPDLLKEEGAVINIGPVVCERSKIELKNLSIKAAGILEKEGIEFAIMTDHPVNPTPYLTMFIGCAIREGLSKEAALRAISINAAKNNGIDDRVGSLEVGKDADLVVYDGDPFELQTKVLVTVINGKEVYRG